MEMEMEKKSFFPKDFSTVQLSSVEENQLIPKPITDPNRPSSSTSSSLRSFSTDSTTLDSSQIFTSIPTALFHYPSQALSQMSLPTNIQLPTLEQSENAAITRAMLAVLTSPSPTSSSSSTLSQLHHPQQIQNLPYNYQQLNPKSSTAFKRYASVLGSPAASGGSLRAQSMMKRAILFCRKINSLRLEQLQHSRPTINQVHHMMSERKRREKINESFCALRSILPSATKKDKASVLTSAKEYLSSLKAQIGELSRQNQLLESQILGSSRSSREAKEELGVISGSSNDRLYVGITPVSEPTISDQDRIIELRVCVRGEAPMMVDILIQLLQFLKLQDNNGNYLMSIEANTQITELGPVNHVYSRLGINEGDGWDESSFVEAVRRLIDNLPQPQ